MKNKSIYIFFIIFLFFLKSNILFADNEFIFESTSIEIIDNGNNISAKNGVQVNSKDGLEIFCNESIYSKISKKT